MTQIDPERLRIQYCAIMEEIKDRLTVIEKIYKRDCGLSEALAFEIYHLELRMICELIALACITAHGDMPSAQTKKTRDAYEPGKILSHLQGLHPAFYPIPVQQHLDSEGDLEGNLSNSERLSDTKGVSFALGSLR